MDAWYPECPPEPEAAPPIRCLAGIPGLDSGFGVENMLGNADAYLRLLARFTETRLGDLPAIRANVESGALDKALRLAHSLAGASGMLGLTGIRARSLELETAFRERHDVAEVDRLTDALEAEFVSVATAITSALSEGAAEGS